MSIFTLCIAGAESTGKSWLADRLAAHFGTMPVVEYARAYCATHGNDLSMAQLHHIGLVQDNAVRAAIAQAEGGLVQHVIADTDAVVTGVWASLSGEPRNPWFDDGPLCADLYIVTGNDLPWEDDGVRVQRNAAARDRFRSALIVDLDRRHLSWAGVSGTGEARLASAIAAIDTHLAGRASTRSYCSG